MSLLNWTNALRVAGVVVLVEQIAETALAHISLAEHPALVIAALGAIGLHSAVKKDVEPKEGGS